MDLSKISIKLRPRNGYAAIDLGVRMAQKNWKLLYASWFIVTLPLYAILLFIFPERAFLMTLIIWWLKPIWERPLLLILSQDVFYQQLSFNEVLKASLKISTRQWFQSLTWRRFSPSRSFNSPVTQLEDLSGKARRDRLSALHSRSPAAISALTIIFHIIETLVALGLFIFILQFLPSQDIEWEIFYENIISNTGLNLYWFIFSLSWFFSMSLMAPFYVAGGFCSYLNQRSIREAWDLELVFRHISEKHKPRKFNYSGIVAALLCLSLLAPFSTKLSAAQNNAKQEQALQKKNNAKKLIKKIQQSPEYNRTEPDIEFRLIQSKDTNKKTEQEKKSRDKNSNSEFSKALAWISLAAIIFYLLYKLPSIIKYFQTKSVDSDFSSGNRNKPQQLFGLDLNKKSLPDDVPNDAKTLWQKGNHRNALSLLYQASLSKLIHDYDCSFEDGFTELECSQIADKSFYGQRNHIAAYFKQLTSIWRALAYGHQLPSEDSFLLLVSEWESNFESNNAQSPIANDKDLRSTHD